MSKDLTDALAALSRDARKPPAEKPQPRGAARRVVSSGQPAGGAKSGGGGGVASPLTEVSTASREYWAGSWHTTDGLFSFPAIKKLVMADANDETVEFRFANPAA